MHRRASPSTAKPSSKSSAQKATSSLIVAQGQRSQITPTVEPLLVHDDPRQALAHEPVGVERRRVARVDERVQLREVETYQIVLGAQPA